MCSVSVKIS